MGAAPGIGGGALMLFRFVGAGAAAVGDWGTFSPVGGTGGARAVIGGKGGGDRAWDSPARTSPDSSTSDSEPSLSGASAGGGAGTGRASTVRREMFTVGSEAYLHLAPEVPGDHQELVAEVRDPLKCLDNVRLTSYKRIRAPYVSGQPAVPPRPRHLPPQVLRVVAEVPLGMSVTWP